MQLVAYGAQDVYLTGNPQITFFKVVYRRHTNFSIETIEHSIESAKPSSKVSVQIHRNGDLATHMALRIRVPAIMGEQVPVGTRVAWVRRLGHALIKQIEVDIGGSRIDKHVGVWLDIWYELTHTIALERGYDHMIGDIPELTALRGRQNPSDVSEVVIPEHTLYIPFQFWFCRNTGLALPLIALQYHEVRVYIDLEDITKLVVWQGSQPPSLSGFTFRDAGVMVDYIYLDSEERRRFAQVGHEYLIEQVQHNGEESLSGTNNSNTNNQSYKLSFNHPTKELIFAMRVGAFNGEANRTSFSGSRGRFLCYTHDNSPFSWARCLDDAACNIARGMVWPCNPTSRGIPESDFCTINGSDSNLGDLSMGESQAINVPLGNGRFITVNVTNDTVTDSGASGSNGLENITLYVLKKNVLVKNSHDLASYLENVTVEVSIDTNNTDKPIAITDCEARSHRITLRDVSIPVEDWDRDNRWTTDSSSRKNPFDVVVIQPNNYGVRLDGAGNPLNEGHLQLNGHDRFQPQQGGYFNYLQPNRHHTRTPADGINVYSFGINPEHHQPSGTANLSRIDTTQLILKFADPFRTGKNVPSLDFVRDTKVYIFALSYNILRIMSGMGGLAYSN